MTFGTIDVTAVRGVRIGRIFRGHRRELRIRAAMTAQAGRRRRRRCGALCVALGAGNAGRDVLVDQKAVVGARRSGRLGERTQDGELCEARQRAGKNDRYQCTTHRSKT